MEITLWIKGQELRVLGKQPNLYHGSVGVLYVKFFDENFDTTLIKTVRFKTEESEWYTADVIDGRVRVPHEVIVVGGFDVAVGGYETKDGKLLRFLPTNSVHIDVMENGYGNPDAPVEVEGSTDSYIAKLEEKASIDFVKKLIPLERVKGNNPKITDYIGGLEVVDYKLYGNSVQNGTPTPEKPIEIQSVGELVTDVNDENYGMYKIAVNMFNGDEVMQTINVYTNEPLRKVGNVADYIDFANQRIVRNIARIQLLSSMNWRDEYQSVISILLSKSQYIRQGDAIRVWIATNYCPAKEGWFGTTNSVGSSIGFYRNTDNWPFKTKAELMNWLDEHNIYAEYPLQTPQYEDISLSELVMPMNDEVSFGFATKVEGDVEITYYKDVNAKYSELKATV